MSQLPNQYNLADIKYLNESGVVEFELGPVVDLKNQKPADSASSLQARNAGIWEPNESQSGAHETDLDSNLSIAGRVHMSIGGVDNFSFRGPKGNRTPETRLSRPVSSQARPTANSNYQTGENLSSELASILNNDFDFRAELLNIGAQVHDESRISQPRYRPIVKKRDNFQDIFKKILSEINRIGNRSQDNQQGVILEENTNTNQAPVMGIFTSNVKMPITGRITGRRLLIIIFIVGLGVSIWALGAKFKNSIVQSGNSAVINLEEAETNLGGLDIAKALSSFSNAYDNFSKTEDSLNFMGSYLGGLIAEIPGNSQYRSARNLAEAGKLFSKAGKSLASALVSVSKTGTILNPSNNNASLVTNLKTALIASQSDIHKAASLLADIDASVIPEDKKTSFDEFQKKISEILKLTDDGVEYARFFENLIAMNGSKKYLILFENPSELRPTGGFPGSYGILDFKNGKLEQFKVDDVYNLDGQLKENIIPPKELQHITPTWGMRDANWFIDFPTSARKIMEFFKKEAGHNVDGVITFSPVIVGKILEVIGPIELSDYGLTLNSENFMQEIQAEVEYGPNRTQPKSILVDLAPKLLEKIYLSDSSKWLKIFNILLSSPENKDVLMYFNDLSLESFILEHGFSGKVKDISDEEDYLMATISNIKGSKTDAVTDTVMKLLVSYEGGVIKHKLVITRKHNGGSEKYGFYNRANPAYIRILVPEDAKLINIDNNDQINPKPLINYAKSDFVKDDDLSRLEAGYKFDEGSGVTTYDESGKKGFGFWLVVDPGETKTVELNYETPARNVDKAYQLYVQKQPGLQLKNFDILFNGVSGATSDNKENSLGIVGDTSVLNYNLDKDLSVRASWK